MCPKMEQFISVIENLNSPRQQHSKDTLGSSIKRRAERDWDETSEGTSQLKQSPFSESDQRGIKASFFSLSYQQDINKSPNKYN